MTTLLNYIIDDFKPRLEIEIAKMLTLEQLEKGDNPRIEYTNNLYVDFEFCTEESKTYSIETNATPSEISISIESQVLFETDPDNEEQATICILYGIATKTDQNIRPQDLGMDFECSSEINGISKTDFKKNIEDIEELIENLAIKLKDNLSTEIAKAKA